MRKILKMIDFILQEWLFDKYLEQWSKTNTEYDREHYLNMKNK